MQITFDVVASAIEASKFQFARTMPHIPHWYTLRKNWNQPVEFEDVVQFIRDYGIQMKWGRYNHHYLQINEWKYWTMGAPLPDTILINRDAHGFTAPYDEIADIYDKIHATPEAERENVDVFARIGPTEGLSVLDVGCGTGLFLEYAKPTRYVGIDPSYKMIDRHRTKFPRATTVAAPLGRFHTAERFDLVASLFGAPSYLDAAELARIPQLLQPGGRYFLMFYKPGYEPVTYRKSGVTVPHHDHPANVLPGKVLEFGNFIIVDGRL